MTPKQWDQRWWDIYDRAVFRGRTPNQAVHLADANTIKSLGERPESKEASSGE